MVLALKPRILKVEQFETSAQKPLGQLSPNYVAPPGAERQNSSNGPGRVTNIAAMPIDTVRLGYCDSDITVCLLFRNMPIIQDRDVKFPYKRYRYYLQAL